MIGKRAVNIKYTVFKKNAFKETKEEFSIFPFLFQYRRLSIPIAYFLSKLKVTPNIVSVFQLAISFLISLLMATGDRELMFVAGVSGPISILLDYIDGSLARATNQTSKIGKALDSVGHYQFEILIPISITSSVFIISGQTKYLIVGSILIYFVFMYQVALHSSTLNDHVARSKSKAQKIFKVFTDFDTKIFIYWISGILYMPELALYYILAMTSIEMIFLAQKYIRSELKL